MAAKLASHNACRVDGGIEVSRSDDRSYRFLKLDNGMKVLLCSDPTTDMAGAALEVSVGHFSDPDYVPGLAHFLEHMLFLGTEKYPDENSYSAYLNEHGGFSNAYTASEETQYQFEVAKDALQGALDRFSTFFTCPLFTAGATGRELEAVDSEHSKNLQNDMWRQYQLDKATSNPAYPYSKFGTGNSVTLRDTPAAQGVDVRQELLKFHGSHYSASRMTLAVLGAEGLDTLEAWVKPLFAAVKDNGSAPPEFSPKGEHPYDGVKGILQHIVPIKDRRQVTVAWAFPPTKQDWKAKSGKYLSHLIGHEGPGSLLSALRERGWATGLFGGESDGETGYSVFQVTVELSPAGLDAWESVLDLVYAYVGMLRAVGPKKWVQEESAALAASQFQFKTKRDVFSTVSALAKQLATYPPAHVLSAPYLIWEWEPEAVKQLVQLMTPENSRVYLISKDERVVSKATLQEKWYGVQYGQEPLGPERMQRMQAAAATYEALTRARIAAMVGEAPMGGPAALQAGLAEDAPALAVQARLGLGAPLPEDLSAWTAATAASALRALFPPVTLPTPNEFIATDFSLKSAEARAVAARREAASTTTGTGTGEGADALPGSKILHGVRVRREDSPTLVRSDPLHELWLLQDGVFAVPKSVVQALLELPIAYLTPRNSALVDLAVALAKEGLTEVAYAADLAGVQYTIGASVYGLSATVSGFNHKLPLLADTVVASIPKLASPAGFTDVAFAVQLDKLQRQYANFKKDQPYQHVMQNTGLALTLPRWGTGEKEAALAAHPATPAELRAFIASALATARMKILVVGNADTADAAALGDALIAPIKAGPFPSVPPPPSTLTVPRVVALPQALQVKRADGSVLMLAPALVQSKAASNASEPNAAMELYCQVGPRAVGAAAEQSALVELVGHIISEPFFDTLRTKAQLGYIVFGGSKHENGVSGMRFLIQSNRVDSAAELVEKTEAFLASFVQALADMPAEQFAAQVKACMIKSSEADKNLSELAGRVCPELVSGQLDFHRATHEVNALAGLTQQRVVQWFKDWMAPGGVNRRVFVSLLERGGESGPVAAAGAQQAAVAAEDEATAEGGREEEEEGAQEAAPAQGEAETLAGGAGQPGAVVSSMPSALTAPVLTLPLSQFAALLHTLHTHQHTGYSPATATEAALVEQAARESCSPQTAAALSALLTAPPSPSPSTCGSTSSEYVRVCVTVGEHEQHAVRTSLPLFHDGGSVARGIRMQAAQKA